MSSTTTMDRISEGLTKARTKLDRLRTQSELLRLDAREKKDEVLRDLESAYADAKQHVSNFTDAARNEAEAAGQAARAAWDTFRTHYKKATGENLEG